MKEYLQLFSQAISSAQAAVGFKFPDPIDAARPLLASCNERQRKLGLRKLRASVSPEASNLARVSYRFASSPGERKLAEECLVVLSSRLPESAGDVALEILRMQSRSSDTFTSARALRHRVASLSRVLESGGIGAADAQEIDELLRSWASKSFQISPVKMQRLLDQISTPWGAQQKAKQLAQRNPELFERINARFQLTHILQAIKGEAADKLRVTLLQSLEPGPYADVVFRTIQPHVEQPLIRRAIFQLLRAWVADYGETYPKNALIEDLLSTRLGIGGPPQYFG